MSRTRMRAAGRFAGALVLAFAGLATAAAANPVPTAITSPSSSANPSVWCEPVTFTARVSAAGALPLGRVAFTDAGRPLGQDVAVDDTTGEAMLTSDALRAGQHAIGAGFEDATGAFAPAISGGLIQRVLPATTTTTLTSSQNPAAAGTPVTLTALVGVDPPADPRCPEGLEGALRFSVDGAPFGPPLPLGRYRGFQVTLRFRRVAATYAIGAGYSGDANSGPSSAVLQQVVEVPTPPPPAGGAPAAPSAPAPSAQPQLVTMSGVLVTALRRRGLAGLTRTTQPFSAPGPGLLDQTVYTPDAPAASHRGEPKLLASARRRFPAAGSGALRLKATRAGRRAIRRARALRLAIVTRFTPPGGAPVTVVNRLTVKPKARSKVLAAGVVAIRPPR